MDATFSRFAREPSDAIFIALRSIQFSTAFMCSILPEYGSAYGGQRPWIIDLVPARATDLPLQTVCLEIPTFAPTVPLLAR